MNTNIYPSREAYAREVWETLDEASQRAILDDYGPGVVVGSEFFGWMGENMDARHNGAVTFTAVDGGYLVDDEAAL